MIRQSFTPIFQRCCFAECCISCSLKYVSDSFSFSVLGALPPTFFDWMSFSNWLALFVVEGKKVLYVCIILEVSKMVLTKCMMLCATMLAVLLLLLKKKKKPQKNSNSILTLKVYRIHFPDSSVFKKK